jgi:hypothetical protein
MWRVNLGSEGIDDNTMNSVKELKALEGRISELIAARKANLEEFKRLFPKSEYFRDIIH